MPSPAPPSFRIRPWHWFLHGGISLALASLFLLFVFQPVLVQGYSMMPRLHNNERLFVDKLSFNLKPLQRGDVVVFRYPLDPRQDFIKRIVGLPGDRVAVWNGIVYINGERLSEPYVPAGFRDHSYFPESRVPPGDYFVLGDHRNSSNDSRTWGWLPANDIFGRAVFAYWPMAEIGLVH